MEDDVLSFLDETPVVEAPKVEPAAGGTLEAPKVDGAAAVAPVTDAAVVKEGAAEAPKVDVVPPADGKTDDKEPKTVPLATFLDILNENKQLKKGAKATETEPKEIQFVVPDPVKNPREYAAYQESMFTLNQMNERMNTSERFATKEYGAELIAKVRDWALAKMDSDEAFANLITNDADPYEIAVKAYNEDLELQQYRAWVAGGKKPEDAPGAKQADQTPPLKKLAGSDKTGTVVHQPVVEEAPSSIVDATSAGGVQSVPVGGGQAFDGIFGP